MCYTIMREYSCTHTDSLTTKCKDYFRKCSKGSKNYSRLPESSGRKKGFLQRLISNKKDEPKPQAGYQAIMTLCPDCEKRGVQNDSMKDMISERAQRVLEQHRARKFAKENFRCTKCVSEGRLLQSKEHRQANSGLCCAHGIAEWEAIDRANGHGKQVPTDKYERPLRRANTQPEYVGQLCPDIATARAAASAAAKRYGWERERDMVMGYHPRTGVWQTDALNFVHLEPNLARDYNNLPGTSLNELPKPVETHYQEPGIDWDRWDRSPQTYHGRYPVPDPAPYKALPALPQKEGSRDLTARQRVRASQSQPQPPQRQDQPRAQPRATDRGRPDNFHDRQEQWRDPHSSRGVTSAFQSRQVWTPPSSLPSRRGRVSRASFSQDITSVSPFATPVASDSPVSPVSGARLRDQLDPPQLPELSFQAPTLTSLFSNSQFQNQRAPPTPPGSERRRQVLRSVASRLDRKYDDTLDFVEDWGRESKYVDNRRDDAYMTWV